MKTRGLCFCVECFSWYGDHVSIGHGYLRTMTRGVTTEYAL